MSNAPQIRRWRSLAEKNIEVPTVKIGKVADFFDHVLEKTHNGRALPTWRGELYFELHRGVGSFLVVRAAQANAADIHQPGCDQGGQPRVRAFAPRRRVLCDLGVAGIGRIRVSQVRCPWIMSHN